MILSCSAMDQISGSRIFMPNALERLKGIKQGDFSTRDVLPKRFMIGESGEAFSLSKEVYYRLRGWSGEGRPTVNKLAELDLV